MAAMRTVLDDSRGAVMGRAVHVVDDFETMLEAMRNAAAALRDAEIPFALAGSVGIYARGGADTRHDVDFPGGVGEAPGDLDQNGVTRLVAEAVVHGLEVVEIEEQDPERRSVSMRAIDFFFEPLREMLAVVHPGQGISNRHAV